MNQKTNAEVHSIMGDHMMTASCLLSNELQSRNLNWVGGGVGGQGSAYMSSIKNLQIPLLDMDMI